VYKQLKIKKMEKNRKPGKALALMAIIFSMNTLFAQVPDTGGVKERRFARDTVERRERLMNMPPLRRGELGIRYMPTFSSLDLRTSGDVVVQGDVTLSHGYGIFLGGNFNDHVGIIGEVNFLEITQKYKDQNLDREVNVSYLNIPVLLSLNTNKRMPVNLNAVIGPQFGVNVGSSLKTTGDDNSATVTGKVGATGSDVGLAYGAGLEFALNRMHTFRIDLGYRGFYGLVDMSANQTSDDPDTFNIVVRAARRTNTAYLGLTWCF